MDAARTRGSRGPGGGLARLARELLLESTLLGVAGGALGLGFAYVGPAGAGVIGNGTAAAHP